MAELERMVRSFLGDRPPDLVCAVSGGADSMALLHILARLSAPLGFRLTAAHLEHGIRGAASLRDCQFVLEHCKKWGIPLFVCRQNVPQLAREGRMGMEEAARKARYAFLEQVRKHTGSGAVVTAHQREDQAETVLMHLVRGAGMEGLSGMQPRQGTLWRPLLGAGRREIESYLAKHGVSYCEDETNQSFAYTRNRVRRLLLPQMRTINPSVESALIRTASIMAQENYYLEQQARAWRERLQNGDTLRAEAACPKTLLRRVVRQFLQERAGCTADLEQTESVCALFTAGAGKRLSLGTNLLERTRDGVRLVRPHPPVNVDIPGPGVYALGEWGVLTVDVVAPPQHFNGQAQYMDISCLGGLQLRGRREGERFHPLNGPGSRKLSDVMAEKGIPRSLREGWPLLARGEEILWILGVARGQPYRLTPNTRQALCMTYHPGKDCMVK